MTSFKTIRPTPLLLEADETSQELGTIPANTSVSGEIVRRFFLKTRFKFPHGEEHEGFALVVPENAREVESAPQAMTLRPEGSEVPGDDDRFCILVTDAARAAGADRDYLLAIAYNASSALSDLGGAGPEGAGPFRFTEATWKAATQPDGIAADLGLSDDHRFSWSEQPAVAARLAAQAATELGTVLGAPPTLVELAFAERFGPGAASVLKQPRDSRIAAAVGNPPPAGWPSELATSNASIASVLTDLQTALVTAYAKALKVIDRQDDPHIRLLRSNEGEPDWLRVAREEQLRGVKEFPGEASNERIETYHAAAGLAGHSDGTAWCGSFTAFCVKAAGIAPPDAPGFASSWKNWGERVIGPSPIGCVVVLKPQVDGTSGHVGFLIEGSDDDRVVLLGGNQGNPGSVSAVSFDAGQVVERRWAKDVPRLKPPPTVPASDGDLAGVPGLSAIGLDTLVRTVWGEARGESEEGQTAVIHVIRNRVARRRSSAETECLRPAQFSCWWDRQQSQVRSLDRGGKAYTKIEEVAKRAWTSPDITQGARHYFAPAGMPGGKPPSWAAHGKVTKTIGRHVFLKDVP